MRTPLRRWLPGAAGRAAFVYHFVRLGLRAISAAYVRVRIEGAERLPPTGGYLICFNHPSWLDPIVIAGWWPDQDRLLYIFGPREADMSVGIRNHLITLDRSGHPVPARWRGRARRDAPLPGRAAWRGAARRGRGGAAVGPRGHAAAVRARRRPLRACWPRCPSCRCPSTAPAGSISAARSGCASASPSTRRRSAVGGLRPPHAERGAPMRGHGRAGRGDRPTPPGPRSAPGSRSCSTTDPGWTSRRTRHPRLRGPSSAGEPAGLAGHRPTSAAFALQLLESRVGDAQVVRDLVAERLADRGAERFWRAVGTHRAVPGRG